MYPENERPEREYVGKEYPAETTASSRLPLSQQEKCLAELHETIAELTRRLTPVLTPMPDPENMKSDHDSPVQSPLADQLQANNGGIRKATSKIRGLIERIEC